MKYLTVFRHARAAGGSSDRERPLEPGGESDAQPMGRELARRVDGAQLVLTSDALRAHTTATLAAEAGAWGATVEPSAALYTTTVSGALSALREVAADVEHVVLVGHEPTWSALVTQLVGESPMGFPPGAMAHVELDIGAWAEIDARRGRLAFLVTPGDL